MGYVYKYRCCGKDCTEYNFCPYCGTRVRLVKSCAFCTQEIEDNQLRCDKHLLQMVGLSESDFSSFQYFGDNLIQRSVVIVALRKFAEKEWKRLDDNPSERKVT